MSGGRADAVTKRDGYRDSVFDASAPLNLDFKGYLSKKGEHHLLYIFASSLWSRCGPSVCRPGWWKATSFFAGYQKRYFVAHGNYIRYYKTEENYKTDSQPLAVVDLRVVEVRSYEPCLSYFSRDNIFQLQRRPVESWCRC